MVQRSYLTGLGGVESAVREFNALTPHVETVHALQMECGDDLRDRFAFGIVLDAVDTAAEHFTRRRDFYHQLAGKYPWPRTPGNGRLKNLDEAIAAFDGLAPYRHQLLELQQKCRPFGRDYLALGIAIAGLDTATYHFTKIPGFYACGDAAGPARRVVERRRM